MPFFINRNGKVHGPFNEAQIKSGQQGGKLNDSDRISKSKYGPWTLLCDAFKRPDQTLTPKDNRMVEWGEEKKAPGVDDSVAPPVEAELVNPESAFRSSPSAPPAASEERQINRYCPECGERERGTPEMFDRPRKCPGCSRTVTFFDYPNDPPANFQDAIEPGHRAINDTSIAISVCLFMIVLLVAVGSLARGHSASAVLFSFFCLVFSILAISLFLDYRRRLARAALFIKSIRRVQEPMARSISETQTKYDGFSLNYKKLVQDKESEFRELGDAAKKVCDLYIKDCVKWISSKLTVKNYHTRHAELVKVIERCRKAGYVVSRKDERQYESDLQEKFSVVVQAKVTREDQSRIKAQMRDEKRREQQIKERMDREEGERKAIEQALAAALKVANDEHNSEIAGLRQKLAEANAKAQRTKSMAEQTKSGHVYVVSNLGSFGDQIYKVGMTRRLDPVDRVKELGDASVPFPFDVHAMISCEDAPTLEKALHRELSGYRVNKVNFRKEFFRTDLQSIINCVEKHHGNVDYVATQDAFEYRESREISDEEFEFVEAAVGDQFSDFED